MSAVTLTRTWSNIPEFHRWIDLATEPIEVLKPSIKAQEVGFDTYTLAHPKRASLSRCLCDAESGRIGNVIQLGNEYIEVPLIWVEGKYTAVQIIQGKRKLEVMRSQKLVLCEVEDELNRWFEVALLQDDLSYPFGCELIGLETFVYSNYPSAKRRFKAEIAKLRKGLPSG